MAAKKKGSGSPASESVRDELLRVTKIKPSDGESDADLGTRVAEKVNALEDNDYDTLSKEARGWYDKTVDAIKAGKAPPKFPARASEPAPKEKEPEPESAAEDVQAAEQALGDGTEGEEQQEQEEEATAPKRAKGKSSGKKSTTTKKGDDMAAKKGKKAAAVKKPAVKKAATAKKANGNGAAPAAAKPQKESMALRVRKLVVQAPDISFENLVKKLGEKHDVGGHAWNIFNHAKQVMDLVAIYK